MTNQDEIDKYRRQIQASRRELKTLVDPHRMARLRQTGERILTNLGDESIPSWEELDAWMYGVQVGKIPDSSVSSLVYYLLTMRTALDQAQEMARLWEERCDDLARTYSTKEIN